MNMDLYKIQRNTLDQNVSGGYGCGVWSGWRGLSVSLVRLRRSPPVRSAIFEKLLFSENLFSSFFQNQLRRTIRGEGEWKGTSFGSEKIFERKKHVFFSKLVYFQKKWANWNEGKLKRATSDLTSWALSAVDNVFHCVRPYPWGKHFESFRHEALWISGHDAREAV